MSIKIGWNRIKFDLLALLDSNPSGLMAIDLLIAPSDLRRLDVIIKEIGENGVLQSDAKKWIPATVIQADEPYSARIRIRGDQSGHWLNKKKSWRITFKKERPFQGRRSINLNYPNDKMLEVEEAAYKLARKLDLLVPDSGFLLVRQNHADMGLYFWTEHLDRYLLERLEYPEGEIFGGDDVSFEKIKSHEQATGNPVTHDFNPAAYKTFIHKNGEVALGAQKRWHDFLELLATRDAHRIDAHISEFLNIEKFSAWYSILLIFGNNHAQSPDNLKWFYDPTTGLFEPILYDVQLHRGSPIDIERNLYNQVVAAIRLSEKVREYQSRILHKIVSREDKAIPEMLRSVYRNIEPYLYRGVEPFDMQLPGVGRFTVRDLNYTHEKRYELLRSNIQTIKDYLVSHRVFVSSQYHIDADGGRLAMEVFPQGVASVVLKSLIIKPVSEFPDESPSIRFALQDDTGIRRELESSQSVFTKEQWTFSFAGEKLVLPRFGNLAEDEKKTWTLTVFIEGLNSYALGSGPTPALATLTVENGVTGEIIPSHHLRSTKVAIEFPTGVAFVADKSGGTPFGYSEDFELANVDPKSELAEFLASSRLPLRVEDEALVLPAGRHEIHQNLVVPKGYHMVLEPGARIYLGPNTNILTFASIRFVGNSKDSVVVDQLVPGSSWGIIGVVSAHGVSVMDHVSLRGGGAGTKTVFEGIYFTGQLNFHGSDVEIANSQIMDSEGEDGLNVKNARFKLENVVFAGNRADAFDGDWVTGSVTSSRFVNNGNDGLDLSGSNVLVVDTILSGLGDKAVSSGEQSKVDIINSRIESSVYGVTAKDLSHVRTYACTISGNRYGLAAYRKKPIFGGGTVEMYGGLLWNNDDDFYIDPVSNVTLNGVGIEREPNLDRVRFKDLRVAEIGDIFELDKMGNPTPVYQNDLPRVLQAGPSTEGLTIDGGRLPDLSTYPVGMLSPLNNTP